MKNYVSLLFLIVAIGACNNNNQKQSDTVKIVQDTISHISNNISDNMSFNNDTYDVLDSLMVELHGNEFVKKDLLKGKQKTDYVNLFSVENAKKLIAYEHKKYASKTKVSYVDMDFIVLEYHSNEDALFEFVKLKKHAASVLSRSAKGSMGNEKQYIIIDGVDPKSGAFIFFTGKTIISLVKRCSGNPLKMDWEEYESKIFNAFDHKSMGSTDVIKSNCGDATFEIVEYE